MKTKDSSSQGPFAVGRCATDLPRREFLKTAAGAALGLASGWPELKAQSVNTPGQSQEGRPNILWITMEDTSAQFIGCYGNGAARTPNMDRLAARGVRFNKAFSTAPVCAPSRSTIITGCLPEILGTGHHRSNYPIPDNIKGFPYYLRQAGYFTSNNSKTDYNVGHQKKFVKEAWDECFGAGGWGTAFWPNDDSFEETSREAGWWHRAPGQPFFSVFNLWNSHQSRTMSYPHAWYVDTVLNKLPEEDRILPEDITVPPLYRDTPKMRRYLTRVYNSLRLTDRELGQILHRLEQDGLADDTIIFCFADHGEGIPRGKTSAFPTGFNVPFFVHFPPKYQHLSPWPNGAPTDELVSSSEDVAPTVLSLAGVEIPDHMTGRPLAGRARRKPRPFVWGARNRIDESPDLTRTVTDGQFFYTRVFMPQLPQIKYIRYLDIGDIMRTIRADYNAGHLNETQAALVKPQQPMEYLFDLNNDPWQIQNLAQNGKFAPQLERLRGALQTHLQEIRDVHFMPEYELSARAKENPPYVFRTDDTIYPFERILAAANLSGAGTEAIPEQLKLLRDNDATVRYWGAVGLDAQGDGIKPFEKEILAALDDPHPSVQIELAGMAFRVFQSDKAQKILERWIQSPNSRAALQALQTIEYLRDGAKPFAPSLHQLAARLASANRPADDSLMWVMDETFHFLEGAPLYQAQVARWTARAEMEPDPSVHFER